ncbi:MAG: hypothetical protein H7256_16470 [Bdellovibrio sp.]|nr:hypothetical protein [Bdellovibrio sp.]
MNTERVQNGLLVSLYVVLLALILVTKKPLCIDSNGVDKIDRVTATKTETIYRCSSQVKVPYSAYFEQTKDQLEGRIESVLLFLNKIDPLQSRFKITIDETKPIDFSVKDNQIRIGSNLLDSPGHFERAIFKIWLNERINTKVDQQNLFTEVAADFLYYAYNGSLNIEDPLVKLKTKIGNSRWPNVLKSKEGYCDSPWKISEHYSSCGSMELQNQLSNQTVLELSLRPLLTSVWIKSYSELSYKSKIVYLNKFSQYLQTQSLNSEKAIEVLLTDSHPLKQGMMNIKKVTDFLNSSNLVQSQKEYREFYARLAINLQQSGVNDSFAEAYFDYLFEYPDSLSTKSEFFKSLVALSIKNPSLQIAVKDQDQIWILPTQSSLPLKTFDQMKTQQHVFFACLGLKDINMSQFFNQTDKLLLIKGCDSNKKFDFASLVSGGVRSFSSHNKNLAFIQFHLPSFEMKAKELAHIKNFFELVKNRDVNKAEFQTLGWSQIKWYEDSQAYKPDAVIDAIELFRTDIN